MTTLLSAYPDVSLQIAGRQIYADDRETLPILNPADETTLGHLPVATPADLDLAIGATAQAFRLWRATSAYDRALVLRRAAGLLRERVDHIATVMTLENGKTWPEARGEVLGSADALEWLADEARRSYGRVVPSRFPDGRCLIVQEPVGPVVAFTPWNAPALTVIRKVGTALAAGCSIVLKAAEETPGTAFEIHRAFTDAGLPADVFQLVFGDPAAISARLLASPVFRKVTFTGSVQVGKTLARLAADTLKRLTLELGGHAPVIVCADADVDRAVTQMADFKFRHSGQVCAAPSRFYVHTDVYDHFVDQFTARASEVVVGDGFAAGVTMGPLSNRRRLDAMAEFVADARRGGARITTGGERTGEIGYFFPPTVIADATADLAAMKTEVFGPIAPIARFTDLDDVVAQANASELGLTAFVFSESERTARHLSNVIEAGLVAVNTGGTSLPETPFGGIKQSGYGQEGGVEGLEAYTTRKLINNY